MLYNYGTDCDWCDRDRRRVWVRATVCCRKTDGKWKIVHEHQSVPFYMDGSYRAVDLKP
jgi:ketosteroid isomerase-like protein